MATQARRIGRIGLVGDPGPGNELQHRLLLPRDSLVAALTGKLSVPSQKGKGRLEVIEELDGESLRAVTPRAVRGLPVLMGVCVTAGALKGEGVIAPSPSSHAGRPDLRRGVALDTGDTRVQSRQRETTLLMIEPGDGKKAIHVVTALAIARQLARMRVLMTTFAGMVQWCKADRDSGAPREPSLFLMVTFCARSLEMGPFEREVGPRIVGEAQRRFTKSERGVTGLALVPKLSQVNVPMAAVTGQAQRPVTDEPDGLSVAYRLLCPVTPGTFDVQVFSGEMKTRLLMIERRLLKALLDMTGGTVLAELPPVGVLYVAVPAFAESDCLESILRVTAPARHPDMLPAERKRGVLAVKSETGLSDSPVRDTVTLRAVGTQGRLVRVAVTVGTARKGDALPLTAPMTLRTLEIAVRTAQVEGRLLVVEPDLGELPLHAVTTPAVASQAPLVNIFMTGDAGAVFQEK